MTDAPFSEPVADAVVLRAMDWDKQDIADELDVHRSTVTRYLDRVNETVSEGNEAMVVLAAAAGSSRLPIPKSFRKLLINGVAIAGYQLTLDKLAEALPDDESTVDVENGDFTWDSPVDQVSADDIASTAEQESDTTNSENNDQ